LEGAVADDLLHHPHVEALLEAAVLAAAAVALVDGAVLVAGAHVVALLLHLKQSDGKMQEL
jgi:hypothetical protein